MIAVKIFGTGKFHIVCPIEKYISTTSNIAEEIRRYKTVLLELSAMVADFLSCFDASLLCAPYPADITASITDCVVKLPSTYISPVSS